MGTAPRVHVLPRIDGGFRACAARVPGCVVIHKDHDFAAMQVKIAVQSLIEEEQGETPHDQVN